jgi:two-component system, sensor histidine kinase RpfC
MMRKYAKAMASKMSLAKKNATLEQEILLNRMVMGSLAAIICYLAGFDARITFAFTTYLVMNIGLAIAERNAIFRPQKRWLGAIILDVTMATATMLVDAEGMSWAYAIILWMVLGNGFRFGIKWLAVASVLSALGFGLVVTTTAFWKPNPLLGYGLVAALIVIPGYCSTLIRKISYAKDQAETANRAKSYFLASVSHELRTPLNAILGYGNHLRQMGLPAKQHDMIDASVLAAEHLLHLIEQLIQVAKAESGSIQISQSSFKMTDVLREVRDIMNVKADEKGIGLRLMAEPGCEQVIEGPTDTIRNLLLNLVGNAIKFTDSGAVSISCSLQLDCPGTHLTVRVSDTGIGIAPDSLSRIFQPFQQADDTVLNRFGGTGLGLAICKQLTEQIGGTILVDSVIGKGSCFQITIPVNLIDGNADTEEEVISVETSVKILSLGNLKPELLASAQAAGDFIVRHIKCVTIDELRVEVNAIDLNNYQIALIDADLARLIEPDDLIWTIFGNAGVAPVLVQDSAPLELEDITLRAAFASVIPSSPDFQTLRSAVRIGCSFARQSYNDEFKDIQSQNAAISIPRKVLVADDNRTNRNVLATILESAGHAVVMVTDGDEAIDALEEGNFDVLLLDVNMPRLNGIDAASMWRQIEGGRSHLPIIGVTADATTETETRCLAAGMDIRITKPFDAKHLLSLIDQYTADNSSNAVATIAADPFAVVVPITGQKSNEVAVIELAQINYLYSIGDQAFVDEMIASFLIDIDETIITMYDAVSNNDVHQFRFAAHSFKSSGQNIGASKLSQLTSKLEHVTETEFANDGERYLAKIEELLLEIRYALTNTKSSIGSAISR